MKLLNPFKFLFGATDPRISAIKGSLGGGLINSCVVTCISGALLEWGKSVWINIVIISLAILTAFITVKILIPFLCKLGKTGQERILRLETAIIVMFAAICMAWLYLQNVKRDVYYENIIDCYGMYAGTGNNDDEPHAGWYKFCYKGVHRKDDTCKHRYPVNRREKFCWWFLTLHSVEMIDKEGRTLPDYSTLSSTRIVFKYREDGLDVEVMGRSVFDIPQDDSMKLAMTAKWYDIGDDINVECKYYDDRNRRIFAPSSTTSIMAVNNNLIPQMPMLQSKFSTYRVLRDKYGRQVSASTVVPDHDGINRISREYADNDEQGLSYQKKETYNASNRDGIRECGMDYNGFDIDTWENGIVNSSGKCSAPVRNVNLWTNLVFSLKDECVSIKGRCCRTIDNYGRLSKQEVFVNSSGVEKKLRSMAYQWSVSNNVSVVDSVEYRDGDDHLCREELLWLSDVFGYAGTNKLYASKIKFERKGNACDALLFDETGTNFLSRIRFFTSSDSRQRIEWLSQDGNTLAPIYVWKGCDVVALECDDRKRSANNTAMAEPCEQLLCDEVRCLDSRGNLAVCPAGWAVRRMLINQDYVDDVNDQHFSGMMRRIEHVGADGKLCRNAGVAAIQEFTYDRNGHVTEIVCRDADEKLADVLPVSTNAIPIPAITKIEYDDLGRVLKKSCFDSTGKPCFRPGLFAEEVYKYVGESRYPSAIYVDQTQVDIMKRNIAFPLPSFDGIHFVVCGGVDSDL